MMSSSDEKRIVAMVDSFTKTVARNFKSIRVKYLGFSLPVT